MKIKKVNYYFLALLSCILFVSCNDMNFELPKGPKGDAGQSAYELWADEVESGRIQWPKDQTGPADFFAYLKGEKGDRGENGLSAYELWKEFVAGGKVLDPHNPAQYWPSSKNDNVDFWDFLTGRDGKTPHIGDNGNWWIGTTDTKVPAEGKNGLNGKDGASAYELWKKQVVDGLLNWPKNQTGMNDFFLYLKGKDGANGLSPVIKDGYWWIGDVNTNITAQGDKGDKGDKGENGTNGKDGEDGKDGLIPAIKNGYWWIGDVNTGVKAQGDQGTSGVSPHIGNNGNWWIETTDTHVSAQGTTGTAGASAYELWVKDVKTGQIVDKNGQTWPEDKITMADFYDYLSGSNGKDGKDGKSAYELWKETVATGNLDHPQKDGEKWPTNETEENDFYRFLAGKNGENGLSAYQIWKEDLAERCGTDHPMIDHKTGAPWKCEKNTLDDFYEYLRGKDGKDGEDGKDGKPGEPGKPGAEVTIIQGVPNVITEYAQPEFGEYVRTTDGGVRYTVYDTKGQIAPGAVVRGMPGIDPNKEYTADDQGKFIVPKEDLPNIQDVKARWGKVKSVTLAGSGESMESAMNTYVPNRIHLRLRLSDNNSPSLYSYQTIYLQFERRLNPEDKWQKVPAYLPYTSRSLEAYQVEDRNDPTSILADRKIYTSNSYSVGDGVINYLYASTYRPMQGNDGAIKNTWEEFWNGSDVYYTLKLTSQMYGETPQWNGTAYLPPLQMGPRLKTIKLKTFIKGEAPTFASAEGELDYSRLDLTKLYKSEFTVSREAGEPEYVEAKKFTEEEFKSLKTAFVKLSYTSTQGEQVASSSGKRSSLDEPEYKVLSPFLNASILVQGVYSRLFYEYLYVGYLRQRAGTENEFYVERYTSASTYDLPVVTYEQ